MGERDFAFPGGTVAFGSKSFCLLGHGWLIPGRKGFGGFHFAYGTGFSGRGKAVWLRIPKGNDRDSLNRIWVRVLREESFLKGPSPFRRWEKRSHFQITNWLMEIDFIQVCCEGYYGTGIGDIDEVFD